MNGTGQYPKQGESSMSVYDSSDRPPLRPMLFTDPRARLELAASAVVDIAVQVERETGNAADTAIVVKARELLAAIETRGTR